MQGEGSDPLDHRSGICPICIQRASRQSCSKTRKAADTAQFEVVRDPSPLSKRSTEESSYQATKVVDRD